MKNSTIHPTITWGYGAIAPQTVDWLEFWPTLEQCGRDGWPQLIRVPASITPSQGAYPRPQVEELLREAGYMLASGEWDSNQPLVTLEPGVDGNFQILRDNADSLETPTDIDSGEESDYRLAVFIDAQGLFRA